MNSNKVKKFSQFISESVTCEKDVVEFLKGKMASDKKEYKGDKPTKYNTGEPWNNSAWLVNEIYMFLKKKKTTSYILMEFGKDCDYDYLKKILKDNFKKEFKEALKNSEE